MTPADAYQVNNAMVMESRDQIISGELPQVYYIAARIRERLPEHVPMEDLVNAGVVGLLEAYRNFDHSKNVQFKTFAKHRISGAILDSLRDLDWASRPLRRKGREVEAAILKLQAILGRYPSETEIADEMGITLDYLHNLLARLDGADLMGQQVSSSFDESETYDLVESAPSKEEENPFELCLQTEVREHLAAAIGQLTQREQLLVSLYYKEELTMKEIAEVLGVAESRISQMHAAVKAKLKASLQHMTSNGQNPLEHLK
jgi:RNA polymerase sigma factor FliA